MYARISAVNRSESSYDASQLLNTLAQRYIWWASPEESLKTPERIILQVMDIGTFEDGRAMMDAMPKQELRNALKSARRGQMSNPSWAYWHYKLGHPADAPLPQIPETRSF